MLHPIFVESKHMICIYFDKIIDSLLFQLLCFDFAVDF